MKTFVWLFCYWLVYMGVIIAALIAGDVLYQVPAHWWILISLWVASGVAIFKRKELFGDNNED